jgi:hypothetical protein
VAVMAAARRGLREGRDDDPGQGDRQYGGAEDHGPV